MRKITDVIPKDDFTLEIHLNNKHVILCDMSERIKGIRFSSLSDYKQFKKIKLVEGTLIRWSSNCELSIDEILVMLDS